MYIPHLFQETDPEVILEFLQENTFVTLVSSSGNSPIASHIPISVKQEANNLILYGHVAKANPIWKTIEENETLVIFQGPHAYVSPEHYDKVESVPTWNYRAAHVYGQVELLTEPKDVEAALSDLISQYEAKYQMQWDNLSEKYKDGMLAGIVGFKMPVTRIEAAAKLSQNKTVDEQSRIANAMSTHPATEVKGVAAAMQKNIIAKERSWVDVSELAEKLELVSQRYARRNDISRNPDWFMHKISEEFGELTQAYLRTKGQARTHGVDVETLQQDFEDEFADVLGHVLLFAVDNNIDIMSAMERKWLHYLSSISEEDS